MIGASMDKQQFRFLPDEPYSGNQPGSEDVNHCRFALDAECTREGKTANWFLLRLHSCHPNCHSPIEVGATGCAEMTQTKQALGK